MPSTKVTLHTKLIEQLLATGHSEVVPKFRVRSTPKYVTFTTTPYPRMPEVFLYVGKAGALRRGRTVTESIPAEKMKAELLAQWDAAHPKKKSK
jgi:hypothetical protein